MAIPTREELLALLNEGVAQLADSSSSVRYAREKREGAGHFGVVKVPSDPLSLSMGFDRVVVDDGEVLYEVTAPWLTAPVYGRTWLEAYDKARRARVT